MAMYGVSNFSPLALRKDHDSVENEMMLSGLSYREIFDLWRKCFQKTYKDKEEETYRFGIFKKAINPVPEKRGNCPYFPEMADQTREELDRLGLVGYDAYILESDICVMNALLEEHRRFADTKVENEKKGLLGLSYREIFDLWRKCYNKTYTDEDEELYRFSIFQKAIRSTPPENCRGYSPEMADRTREELDKEGLVTVDAFILGSDIFEMSDLLEYRRIADPEVENEKDFALVDKDDFVGEQQHNTGSVENEKKDFAPPIKKLKVDKDGLAAEHNTESDHNMSYEYWIEVPEYALES